MFQGHEFLDCCGASDYSVTVGGVDCPITAILRNELACEPSQERPIPSDFDFEGGSRVVVFFCASIDY